MTDADSDAEQRLAVLTSWGIFGSFSLGLILTGFRADAFLVICAGYLLLVAGFVSHLIVNRIYETTFRAGEIAAAITLFGVSTLAFMANWALSRDFTRTDVLAGTLGIAVVPASFVLYLATRYGLRGAFSMFHIHRDQ